MWEALGWIWLGLVIGLACARPIRRHEQERRDRSMRRIGWGYGYGAGYTDATAGREYDLTPPEEGYERKRNREAC